MTNNVLPMSDAAELLIYHMPCSFAKRICFFSSKKSSNAARGLSVEAGLDYGFCCYIDGDLLQ